MTAAPEPIVADGTAPPGSQGPLVAVVGGGIAGLSAAWHLSRSGASVLVVEADRPGGQLATVSFAGRAVDEGADAFATEPPDAVDFATQVGVADQLVAPSTDRGSVWSDGALQEVPLARMPALSADPDADDLARALAPPTSGAGDPADPPLLAPSGGMATFVEAAVAALEARGVAIHRGVTVRSVERLQRSWHVIADEPRARGVATDVLFEAEAVVLATPAAVAGGLIADHAPIAGMHLGAIPHASVATALFAFDPADIESHARGAGFVLPRSSGQLLTGVRWLSSTWDHLAPAAGDGTVLVQAAAGRAGDRRIAELDDAALIERLATELTDLLGVEAAPVATHLRRWPSAVPRPAPGHAERIAEVHADLEALDPPVAVAGSAFQGGAIPETIASGRRAAERTWAALAGPPGRSGARR